MKTVPLKYWLEQQVNINVYRIYVERPIELTHLNLTEILLYGATNTATGNSDVGNGNSNNGNGLAKISNQILRFDRKSLNISFNVVKTVERSTGEEDMRKSKLPDEETIKYVLRIDFSKCEIDPEKCTMDSIDQHWVMRLPFYYPGNEKRCDRMYLFKAFESSEVKFFTPSTSSVDEVEDNHSNNTNIVNNSNNENIDIFPIQHNQKNKDNGIHCYKCNAKLVHNNTFTMVKKSPSSAFTYLSQHWYCLQQQGAKRLERLAPNGILPIHNQSIIINQASFLFMQKHIIDDAINVITINLNEDDNYNKNHADQQLHRHDHRCSNNHTNHSDGSNNVNSNNIETMKGLICKTCKTMLGVLKMRPLFNQNENIYKDVPTVELYKYNLKEFRGAYTVDSLVGHIIASSFNSNNTRTFQIKVISRNNNKNNPGNQYIIDRHKWLNITLFDIDVRCSNEATNVLSQAMKILYKVCYTAIPFFDNSKNIDTRDREVIYLSLHSFNTLLKRLNYVNKKLPKSLSKMKFKEQMDVSVLYW
eukprot:g820.t1